MYYESFLLGPLEALRKIPSPFVKPGVATPVERFGGVRTSISGKGSSATYGLKRSWTFTYPLMSLRQNNFLRAFYNWSQPRALRFLDPLAINLVSADASMGGSLTRTNRAITVTAGTVTRIDLSSPALNSFLATFIDSAYSWAVPTSTAAILTFDDTLKRYIILRDLRQRVLTMEVTGSGTVQALVRPYNIAGVAQSDVLGSSVVLDGTWKPVTLTYNPAAVDYSCKVGLSIATAVGIRTPVITAVKFRDSNDVSEWSVGEGLGEVLVTAYDPQYRELGKTKTTFTVREV